MSKMLASSLFLLVLCACTLEGTTHIHRVGDALGGYSLHSRAHVLDGVARFECKASRSGRCHYTLYPKGCDDRDCMRAPLRRFAVAQGQSLQLIGEKDFRLCVSADATPQAADCEPAASGIAMRR